ncbi:unnamed protein product [Rangifer tarandus platyrhynchus]|uniref:Uncharacterized protein n=2 Tax=Rangifer tarandus platyrhynchus TaxID=3082113 RepID=A0AC59YQL2_RANTA|nr:unnamed protein product [Rangifer tarandus platyrhynchus]
MKVGLSKSWVSLVQWGSFNDQNRQLTETTVIITGNTAVTFWPQTLSGEILCNANMELFRTFIFLRLFCISGFNKRCGLPLLQHLTNRNIWGGTVVNMHTCAC